MDEELFEIAKDYDLSYDEAEELRGLADEYDLDLEEAAELKEELE